jgi:hypothetical protein
MKGISMRITWLACALVALSTAPAAAECLQDQLTGDWALVGSNNGVWTSCNLSVVANGEFEGRCRGTNRRPRRTGTPVDGLLEVNPACDLTGAFTSGQTSQEIRGGVLDEGGTFGPGALGFGTTRQNFGVAFTLIRRPDGGEE